ncbi:uncharacterized protein LOC132190696 [Corylus avellana]|uniref:uncharacterized protein LOC132190696 n=1 Tax=Corylus avellana TaxID=13451 RepID=UPI00286A14F0|nr:uncharacterized protein LOC132190696 [Corylus avellana]
MEEEKWKAPPMGKVKTNWDIATDSKQNRLDFGVIIRDDRGRVLTALSKTLNSIQELVVGEAMGALAAVEFSRDSGFFDVILEGDSKQVVDAITNTGPSWSKYEHIAGDIQEVRKTFRTWEVRHVKRVANEAAHRLAKAAIREEGEGIWLEDTPNSILDVVTLGQSALFV